VIAAVVAAVVAAVASLAAAPPPARRCGRPSAPAVVVGLHTSDGVRLDGAIVGHGSRGVVLVHETGRLGLCGWWPYATRLAARGFRALVFDLRCSGFSECSQQHGDAAELDVGAAAAELRRRGCTSVELVGASSGGSAVLVAAAHDARIAAVANLSGDVNELDLGVTPPTTAQAAAARLRMPVLFALARDDPYVTVPEERAIYRRVPARAKQLVVLPRTAGHGWDMVEQPSFDRRLTAFLRRHAS